MNQNILETVLRLKDQLTPALQKAAGKGSTALDKVARSSKKMDRGLAANVLTWAKVAAAIAAATIIIRQAIIAFNTMIGSAIAAEVAQAKLETAVSGNTDALIEQASALQTLTGIADDVIMNSQAMLGTFALNAQEVAVLTPRILDMAAALQQAGGAAVDVQAVAIAMGKAVTIGAGALSRYGVVLTDTQRDQLEIAEGMERVQVIAEILDNNFAGLAETVGMTFAGEMNKGEAAFDDFLEVMGGFITNSPKVRELIKDITGRIITWTEKLRDNEGIQKLVDEKIQALIDGIPKLIESIKTLTKVVDEFGKPLVFVLGAIAGTRGLIWAFGAWRVAAMALATTFLSPTTGIIAVIIALGIAYKGLADAIERANAAQATFRVIQPEAAPFAFGGLPPSVQRQIGQGIFPGQTLERPQEFLNFLQGLADQPGFRATPEQAQLLAQGLIPQLRELIAGRAPGPPGPPEAVAGVAAVKTRAELLREAQEQWIALIKRGRDNWATNMAAWNTTQEEAVQRARDITLMLNDVIEQASALQRQRDIAAMIERRQFPPALRFDPAASEGLLFRVFGGQPRKRKKGQPRFGPDFLETLAGAGIGGFAAGGARGGIAALLPVLGAAFGPIGGAIGGALASIFGKKKRGATRANPVFTEEVKKGDMALALLNIFKGGGAAAGGRTINDINNLIRGGGATLGFSSAPQ